MAIDHQKLAVYYLLDMSGSMNDENRLSNSKEVGLMILNELVEYDDDGMIHLVTFGGKVKEYGPVDIEKIEEFYRTARPDGGTPLAEAIEIIEDDILLRLNGAEAAHQLVVITTDGLPNDQNGVVRAISRISKHVKSSEQLAFLFVQVGTDRRATEYLVWLDDNVKKHTNGLDLIDTIHFSKVSDMSIEQLIIKAFED